MPNVGDLLDDLQGKAERLERELRETKVKIQEALHWPHQPTSPAEQMYKKALKLLEALAEPHATGNADHAWRKCRRCLALAELDSEGARQLFAHFLATLKTRHQ